MRESMFFEDPNFVLPVLFACFEGEEETPGGETPGDETPGDEAKFTQADVNRLLAENKRGLQEKLKELEKAKSTLETSYQGLLQSKNLEDEQRGSLEKSLKDLQAQFKTKEQRLADEKKELETQAKQRIDSLEADALKWKTMFTDSSITNSLITAASEHEAYNENQIVTVLRSQTKLVDKLDGNGKPTGDLVPMVEMNIMNAETNLPETLQMTPSEAVAQMKRMPEWQNLFRSNVRSGLGGNSNTGDFSGDGNVDVKNLTTEQYMEIRKSNPEKLGLGRTRDPWRQ